MTLPEAMKATVMDNEDSIYQQLTRVECLELLQDHRFGRIAVVRDGQPIVFPINYALDDDTIVFRTDVGTKLAGAVLGPIAFEIDGIDEEARTGWSIIVQGQGHEISWNMDERSRHLRELDVQPWVPGDRVRWVEIHSDSITGRRLRERKPFETRWTNR